MGNKPRRVAVRDVLHWNSMKNKLNVFRASAGSGKTFQLTAQFLSLLLQREHADLRRILAVTFTNKATYEMKTRIMQHLYDVAYDPAAPGSDMCQKLMAETGLEPEVLQKRARQVLHQLLHNYDDFYVQTIDSFLQRLLQNLAHELGLMSNYSVNLDDDDVIARAVDKLIAQITVRPDVLNWLVSFITDNIESGLKWDFTAELRTFAKNLTKEVFLTHRRELDGLLTNDNFKDYRKQLEILQNQAENRIVEAAEALLAKNYDYKSFSRGGNVQKVIEKFALHNFEPASMGTYADFLEDETKLIRKADIDKAHLKKDVKELWEDVRHLEDLRQENLRIINTCKLCKRNLNPYRLLNEIDVLMTAINSENNRFMLSRTPLLFNELVGDDDTSFVYEKAGIQYDHVMIDEFQDTSHLQWKNFRSLIQNSLASGHSNLIVGDVKQSIYRWRNGDWSILQNMREQFRDEQYHEEPLSTNHRSGKEIVEFNTSLFCSLKDLFAAHLGDRDAARLKNIFADVGQEPDPKRGEGYVWVNVGDGEKWADTGFLSQQEAANLDFDTQQLCEMGNIMRHMRNEGCPFSNMGILVRYRGEADTIQRFFAREYPEIRLISDDAFVYKSSSAVMMLMAALKLLYRSDDTISKLYLAEKYQHEILKSKVDKDTIVSRAVELLPEDFVNAAAQLRRMPLYELCERLIHLFSLNLYVGQELYLMSFLDQVIAFLNEYQSDLGAFITYWDELLSNKSMPSEKIEGVQIMTIHKAKGLAFHTLFVPYFNFYPLNPNDKNFLWVRPPQAPFNKLPLLPIKVEKRMERSLFHAEYDEEKFQNLVESLNMLYVALTRPKKNMFIWLPNASNNRGKKSMDVFMTEALLGKDAPLPCFKTYGKGIVIEKEENKDAKGAKQQYVNPFETVSRETVEVRLQNADFNPVFRQSNESIMFLNEDAERDRQQSYIDNGKMLHYIFSTIETMSDIGPSIRALMTQGLVASEKDAQKLAADVEKWICQGHCEHWFDGHYRLYNECEILEDLGNHNVRHRRPDRVMVTDEGVTVVDFKFGKPNVDYVYQVRDYVDLLCNMGYKNVKGYLWYVYLNRVDAV